VELRHLRSFLAVAETGNVTKAAALRYIAQSALSTQIAQLETELGNPLFARTHRGVYLTPAGLALVPRATRLLAEVDLVAQEQAALRGVLRGRLRLGMVQGAPAHLGVVAVITEFHQRYPDVDLSVHTGASTELLADVAEGRLDASLIGLHDPHRPAGVVLTHLADDPLVGIVAARLAPADGGNISVARLVRLGIFVHYRRGTGLRLSVDAAFDRARVQIGERFALDNVDHMVRLAAAGVGVTIVASSVLDGGTFANDPPFAVLRLTDPLALHTISLATTKPATPAAEALLTMLRSGT
jgi:DNA-binding transcriptional LysR family regulator